MCVSMFSVCVSVHVCVCMQMCIHMYPWFLYVYWYTCMYVYMQMCTHVYHCFLYAYQYAYMYACMQICTDIYGGSKLMLRIILGHFSTLLIEARFLSQIQSLDTCLVLVIRLALGIPLISVSGAGIDTGCHAHLTCT